MFGLRPARAAFSISTGKGTMTTSTLGFTVALACDEADLADARHVRAAGYGHHGLGGDTLHRPDEVDYLPDSAVFVARDKASGQALGTVRVQCRGHRRLLLEDCVDLPGPLGQEHCAEVARLATLPGVDPLVKITLMKATFLECIAGQVQWMVIGARSEALVRSYKRLGFHELLDGAEVPLHYAGGVPHRVLAFHVQSAERTWLSAGNGLYDFMVKVRHPDLSIHGPRGVVRLPLPMAA
jgi:hypothetical protein